MDDFDITLLEMEANGLIELHWDELAGDYRVIITDKGREVARNG